MLEPKQGQSRTIQCNPPNITATHSDSGKTQEQHRAVQHSIASVCQWYPEWFGISSFVPFWQVSLSLRDTVCQEKQQEPAHVCVSGKKR